MANSVVWDGLAEYQEQLRKLPEECLGEAAKLIQGETNAAYVTIAAEYERHIWTGTLRRLLTLKPSSSRGLVTGVQLRSGSPLAWLFDHGSQARHWASGKLVGRMPASHIFSRTVGQARRRLAQLYAAMLLRRGAASVTGE